MDSGRIILWWFVLAIVVGVSANLRGRSGPGWFLLAVVISPLIAGLFLIAAPRIEKGPQTEAKPESKQNLTEWLSGTPTTPEHKRCPYCDEAIRRQAVVCKHCGRDLPAEGGDIAKG
jgi:hypothetical protein